MSADALRRATPFTDGWLFVPAAVDPDIDSGRVEQLVEAQPVSLPHTWNAVDGQDGGGDYHRGTATYLRRFSHDAGDDEVWLEVHGANASTDVFVNGTLLARHDGGYSTFRVELTPALRADNLLQLRVDNGRSDRVYPQRADFTFYGGLYREVNLITVPRAHFALDDHGGPGLVVTPELDGARATVRLEAAASGGSEVLFTIEGVAQAIAPVVDGTARAELTIDDVHRWHGVDDPHLYTATAVLRDGDAVLDSIQLRFGCREFAVDPERGFLLNGAPYPLRGVARHQDWEGVGNAITPEMQRRDLALIQELGANTVRLAHYQHDQYFYDLCDEAGIIVWAEIPQITEFLRAGIPNAASQLTELIVQNRHHASIVCWGLSNEITVTGNGPDVLTAHRELNDLAHRLDPTRMTAMAHLFLLEPDDPLVQVPDISSYNLYYGWYVGEVDDAAEWLDTFHATHPDTAIGLSEYGADANHRLQSAAPVRGDYSEQFQALYHERMLQIIGDRPWLWATHVWALADFGSDSRDEGGVPGRNMKGLVSFDRSVRKDAFYVYKAAWSSDPFVHIGGRRYEDRAESTTEVVVYSNLPEISLWKDDELVGTQRGERVFRFPVPLSGEHTLTARGGHQSDSITVRHIDAPNPDYVLPVSTVINWFDDDELPSPDGFFSIRDTMADIRANPLGARLIDQLMAQAAASRGEVAQNVEIPEAMQRMVDRMSVENLLKQAGAAIPAEQIVALNAALNGIAK